jgi:hypothetical protein
MCHHMSGMEQLAYKLGMLQAVCRARLSGMAPYFVTSLCDIFCELPESHCARRDVCARNLSTASGYRLLGSRSKA